MSDNKQAHKSVLLFTFFPNVSSSIFTQRRNTSMSQAQENCFSVKQYSKVRPSSTTKSIMITKLSNFSFKLGEHNHSLIILNGFGLDKTTLLYTAI